MGTYCYALEFIAQVVPVANPDNIIFAMPGICLDILEYCLNDQ